MSQLALGRRVVAETREADRTNSRLVMRLGFWSAVLTAVCLLVFLGITLGQGDFLPLNPPTWSGMAAYISSFNSAQMLWVVPVLVLVPVFVVLMAAVQADAPQERKILAQLALVFAVVYATLESINYGVQLLAVWPSIESGEGQGLGFFAMTNPHGFFIVFEALAYPFQQVGLLFAAFVYTGRGLGRLIRWSLIGASFGSYPIVAALTLIISALGLTSSPFLLAAALSTDLWAVFLALAAVLLALHFRAGGSDAVVRVGPTAAKRS